MACVGGYCNTSGDDGGSSILVVFRIVPAGLTHPAFLCFADCFVLII